MGGNRDDFSAKTKDILAKQVAFRCSNPNCRKLTCGSGTKKDAVVNIGVAAHICAAAPGGKRYDPNMTKEQRKDVENGIWLCQSCAKLIDSDEVRYTMELLREWKDQARKETSRELEFKRGEGDKHTLALNEVLKHIPVIDNRLEYLDVEMYLNSELERLVEKMEEIQRKIELARTCYDGGWAEIYEKQFYNTRSLFLDIDRRIEMIQEQKALVHAEFEKGICASASGVGSVYMWKNQIHCAHDSLQTIQNETVRMARLLADTWQMAEAAECRFVECDEERRRQERVLEEILRW